MKIADILSSKRILLDMDCRSKKDALDTLAKSIADADNSTSQIEVFDCLCARERLGSTGLGNGIAIPHGRLKDNEKTIAAFLKLGVGIDYDAVDKAPVDLIFALIVPENSTDEHLQTLATLAEICSNTKMISRLRQSCSAMEIFSLLTG